MPLFPRASGGQIYPCPKYRGATRANRSGQTPRLGGTWRRGLRQRSRGSPLPYCSRRKEMAPIETCNEKPRSRLPSLTPRGHSIWQFPKNISTVNLSTMKSCDMKYRNTAMILSVPRRWNSELVSKRKEPEPCRNYTPMLLML